MAIRAETRARHLASKAIAARRHRGGSMSAVNIAESIGEIEGLATLVWGVSDQVNDIEGGKTFHEALLIMAKKIDEVAGDLRHLTGKDAS